jgi:hypothetical protein
MSDLVTEAREVGAFREISFGGVGKLFVRPGETETLTVEARRDILPHIVTEVKDQRLVMRFEKKGLLPRTGDMGSIHFHVTVRELEGIDVSGAAKIEGSELSGETFSLRVSGAARARLDLSVNQLVTTTSGAASLTLGGKTESQRVTISGASNYNAEELASRDCRVDISGAGKARVRAEAELDVHISGAGTVLYAGTPVVHKRISGVGRVRPIEESR